MRVAEFLTEITAFCKRLRIGGVGKTHYSTYGILSLLLIICGVSFYAQAIASPPVDLVQPTVYGAVVDGVQLAIPGELGNQNLAELGLVDPTAAPFYADPTGKRDSTKAIQEAVNFARDHQMVCFFPSGTYMISDTISCIQNYYRRSNGKILSARNFPCVLMGSRDGKRPVIYLKPNSTGYGNRFFPKHVIHYWTRNPKDHNKPAPPLAMNQMFINIDILIGENNPGAVAIRHRGAQGSGIQESVIHVGDGLTGIEGGCGSGGSYADITVIGGRIGLDLRETQPAPTITGITLTGQEEAAIIYQGRQALSAVGVTIDYFGKGIPVVSKSANWSPFHGQISFVDSRISRKTPGHAVVAGSSIYLKNVFVKNVSQIISGQKDALLAGSQNKWVHVQEYTFMVQPKEWRGWQYSMNIFEGGIKRTENIRLMSNAAPPEDLQRRHLWDRDFPGWETPGAVNVKTPPYNAKGDGYTDDTKAIQQAIDKNKIVFLPKGYYNISKSLVLKPDTQLIGVARHLSVITSRNGCRGIDSPAKAAPLVQSARTADSDALLAFLSLHTPYSNPDTYCLDWQCNGVVRDVNFDTLPPFEGFGRPIVGKKGKRTHPLLFVSGDGSGKIFNFFQDDGYRLAFQSPYSHIGIKKAKGPLAFYQCNPERSAGECNIKIEESTNVSFYGIKGEGNQPVMIVRDSKNINVFGYGGNGAAHEGGSLFIVEDSPGCSFVNLVDSPRFSGEGSAKRQEGYGLDPDKWHMIKVLSGGKSFTTPFLERPLLVKTASEPIFK